MDFLKYLIGIVTIAALIAWYCMFGNITQEPGGTLVDQVQEVML